MLLYSNAFNCSATNNKDEIIIRFAQRSPNISPEDGTQDLVPYAISDDSIQFEIVSSIVMTNESARMLMKALQSVFGDN